MDCKYNLMFSQETVITRIRKLSNLTYKLLPIREENKDWRSLLGNILEEFSGMARILQSESLFFPLICKLEGLYGLDTNIDFLQYRSVIFECINLEGELINDIQQ